MPNERGNNTNNDSKNKFPNQGNFSASQNNAFGKFGQINNIANNPINRTGNNNPNEKKVTDEPDNALDKTKKEVGKKGLEMAANAAVPGSGALAKAALNSKLGNKAMNAATNMTKSPLRRFGDFIKKKSEYTPEEVSEETDEYSDEQPQEAQSESLIPKEVTSAVIPAVGIGGLGCLGVIVLIAIVASVVLAPIFGIQSLLGNIKQGASNFWDRVVYFFKGCSSETECNEKEKNSFYEKLLEVHEKYQGEPYYVTLNTELITATLTYSNPMALMEDLENIEDIESSTSSIDFKKSEKKIKELAEQMVSKGKKCVDLLGTVVAQYEEGDNTKCPDVNPNQTYYYKTEEDRKKDKKTSNTVKEKEWYYLDEEKYRNYLEDGFIKKFYFNDSKGEDTDKKVTEAINDIYARVEMVKYLNSSSNSAANFTANNSQVIIMDCTGNIELETISLYEYLQGVLYLEGYATNRSEEFLKVQAVIAKNYIYAINGATPDSIMPTLRIRSCQMNQVYCSVENGCHNMNDGQTDGVNDAWDTIASGPGANGEYHRPPVTDVATLEKIKSAINATLTDFIVKDGNFVTTQYRSVCTDLTCDSTTNILDQAIANNMITSGSTYKDVLNYFYDGELQELTLGAAGYPLDLVYNNVTSAYGWRVHPINGYCRTHGGTDIAAPSNSNIYSIADGVIVTVDNMPSKINGYGYYMVIGHGNYINGKYEYYSLYAHQIRMPSLSVGDAVKAGQVIGNVGSTGASTGPHLHIEIYTMQGENTKVRQDPVEYFKGVELTGMVGGALYGSCQSCVTNSGTKNVCQ